MVVAPRMTTLMRSLRRSAVLLLPVIVVVAGLLVWAAPSPLILKKVVALMLLPAGWVWLGLMVLAAWPEPGRWKRACTIIVLLIYTLAGNVWFGGWLLGRLEAPYAPLAAPAERFDAICVLGGGTSARPDGTAQLGPAGDRLIVPAHLVLTGMCGHLVASGRNVTDIGGGRSLADDTATIWRELGIPESSITRLPEPRTTKEEIRAYRKPMETRSWKRVGVCSSAWHLRRVEKICRDEGLAMVPVPADFLSVALPWNAMYAVPQARGFQNVQKALWEYLGTLTGG